MWRIVTEGATRSVCHHREPCKNGWTDRDAARVVDSGGPKEPWIRWDADPPCKGTILRGKWVATVKYRVSLPWCVQKRLNRLICCLYRLRWAQGSAYYLVHIRATGQYDWTVHVRRWCSLFVKLLWTLVIITAITPSPECTFFSVTYFKHKIHISK